MLSLCNIMCYSISVEIYAICHKLFEKQPVIMCLYSYSHLGTNSVNLINEMLWSRLKQNVAEPSQMKCCGAVSNEMSFSENIY